MDRSILTALITGKPIVLHAMTMKEFSLLLQLLKELKA